MANVLKLSINSCATRLAPVSGGVDFVGFIIRPGYKLVRRRVIGNLKMKLRVIEEQLVSSEEGTITYKYDQNIIENCLAMVNSYLGHFRHARTRKITQKFWQLFPFLRYYFHMASGKVVRHDRPLYKIDSMRQQIRWLMRKYRNFVCIIQIGCYFECFERDAVILSKISGYRLRTNWRGFRYGCGFPNGLLEGLRKELEVRRVPYIIVRQTGRELYRTKERLPYLLVRYEGLKRYKYVP